jgi:hypothetical protein
MALVEANDWPVWPKDKPFPTLGHSAVEWIEANLCHGPGDVRGMAINVTEDLYRFYCRALIIHPKAICGDPECECEEMQGRFVRKINVLSRLKGYAKTEDVAWILHWKLSGACQFGGWLDNNEIRPVLSRSPYIPVAATSEDQAEDTLWGCFVAIASEAKGLTHLKVTDRRVFNPMNDGEAKMVTSSSARNDGGKPTAVGLDEAHLMHGTELLGLGKTVERNLAKRNIGDPQMFIATTMFMVGQNSYAELLWNRADNDTTILYDHRQASDHWDTTNDTDLRAAIKEAAGDALGWLNVRQMMSSYKSDPSEGERYWLNRYGGGGNAKLVNISAFRDCPLADPLRSTDTLCIGIDGSQFSDMSGIVACRLSDLSLHYIWSFRPDGTEDGANRMAREMDETVIDLLSRFLITRIYADPPYITELIARWSGLATKSKQRGLKPQVVSWYTNRYTQMANATRELTAAINLSAQPHDHNPLLYEHFANAYKKEVTASIEVDGVLTPGYIPRKVTPKSQDKIDLSVCSILARQAAVDSLAAGEDKKIRGLSTVIGF